MGYNKPCARPKPTLTQFRVKVNPNMEQVRKFVYDQISDKQNLLEVTTVRYENERRYEDCISFKCF